MAEEGWRNVGTTVNLYMCVFVRCHAHLYCRFYEISQKLHHLSIFESHEDILLPEALRFAVAPADVDRLYLKHKKTLLQQQQTGGVTRRATFCGAARGSPSRLA